MKKIRTSDCFFFLSFLFLSWNLLIVFDKSSKKVLDNAIELRLSYEQKSVTAAFVTVQGLSPSMSLCLRILKGLDGG